MNSSQILNAIEGRLGNECKFIGIYFSDELWKVRLIRKKESRPIVCIVNTLRLQDTDVMGHYLTFYCDTKNKLLYFIDSYALKKEFYNKEINEFCKGGLKICYLPFRMQDFASFVCGLYAIFFTITLSREGVNAIETAIRLYFRRGKYKYNDAIIVKHMYTNLGDSLPPYNSVFLPNAIN